MQKQKSRSPEIRFKQYTGAWEQRKLGEIASIFDGTHQTPKYTDSGIKFVSVENISNLETKKHISQEAYEKEYTKKQAERGDVLMTRIGDIGTAKVIETDEPLAYYVTLALMKPKLIESYFLSWLISSPEVQRNIWKRTLHIAFPKKINLGEINQVEVMVPDRDEQNQIGNLFKKLDDTITLHQRKLEILQNSKKSLLQKMFPKKGETVPEIRFPGFTDTWEKFRLGDLSDIKTGSSDLQDADINGKYPFFVRSENIERSNRYLFDGEAILIPGEGRLGEIYHYIDGKFDYHQRVYKVSDFEPLTLNGRFALYYLQQNFKRHALKFTAKATVDSLRQPMLTDFEIKLPTITEQEKIGTLFINFDNLITLHQRKLETLKRYKKTMLQKMFI